MDDAARLLLAARKESGGFFHEYYRNVVDIAEADEAGNLHCRVAVNLAGGDRRVVGAEADHMATQTPEGGDDLPGPFRLQLEIIAMVTDLLDDNGDIERGVEAGRRVEGLFQQGVDLPGLPVERVAGILKGRCYAIVVRDVGKEANRCPQGRDLIGNRQVGHAGLAVHLRSAQFLRGYVLAEHRLDDARAGETE